MDCALCGFKHDNLKSFSDHLRSAHTLNSEQYTIRALHDGIRPVCAECGSATRYTTFAFKEFCSSHAKLAMKLGGKREEEQKLGTRARPKTATPGWLHTHLMSQAQETISMVDSTPRRPYEKSARARHW